MMPLLPNDGILDWIAVDIAATGVREVRLTKLEQMIADAIRYGTATLNLGAVR